jgi:pimeloyl-ACP methyl ester carboxylesterase
MRLLLKIIGSTLRWSFYGMLVAALCAWIFMRVFVSQAEERETLVAEKSAPEGGRYVKTADVELYIQDTGTLKGEDVIIVPGFGGWTGMWQPAAKALAEAGYRVITIDLPPFGYSQRPKLPHYDRQYQAERIISVLNTLGIDSAIVVAHSTSSGPAVEAALMAPKRVRALVLVDALLDIAHDRRVRRYPSFVVDQVLSRAALREGLVATFITNPLFNEDLLRRSVRDAATITDQWLTLYRQPLAIKGTTPAIGEWLLDSVLWSRAARSDNPDAYRKMKTPVHVLWGDDDPVAPYARGREFVAMLPNAVLKVMHGVGHLPHIEDARNFHTLLINSLNILTQDYHAAKSGKQ